MSQVIDTKVVEMQFDNSKFEKNIETSLNSLKNLNKNIEGAGKNRDSLDGLAKAGDQLGMSFENINVKSRISLNMFDMLSSVGTKAFMRISDAVAGFAMNMAQSLSGMQAMRDGFNEYELKMGSVQTILTGAKIIDPSTGKALKDEAKRLDVINQKLQDLNTYSDKTIYSFKDMTSNIGKFTNNGVELGEAVQAIQGVANVAAAAGANSSEASRAMYNFSQALSSGAVKLIDWKSIENANMATQDFKQQLLDTALVLGTVVKEGNEYKTTTTDLSNKTSDLFTRTKGFNDSLAHQWMTTEVLTQTLKNYSTDVRDMSDNELTDYKNSLLEIGYTTKQVERIIENSRKAFEAATEVKTFTQMIDTLKESLGSGWAQTFEIVIGDFMEAKALFTGLNNTIDNMLSPIGEARNAILQMWKDDGGRTALLNSFSNLYHAVLNLLDPIKALWKAFTPNTTNVGKALATVSKWIEQLTLGIRNAASYVGRILATILKPVIFVANLIGQKLMELFGIVRNFGAKVLGRISPLKDSFKKFGETVSKTFDKRVTSKIKSFQTTLSTTFDNIKKRLKESKTIQDLVGSFNSLKTVLHDLFGRIIANGMIQASSFANYLKKIWEAVSPLVSSAFTTVLTALSNTVLPRLRKAIGWVSEEIRKFGRYLSKIDIKNSKLYKGLSSLPERIKEFSASDSFKSMTESMKGFGSESLTFISNKFKELKGNLDSITMPSGLKNVFETIKDFIRSIFGKNSVGEETKKAGDAIEEMTDRLGNAEELTLFQKFLGSVTSALGWFKDAADQARDSIKGLIDFIKTNTPKAIRSMHNFLAGEDGLLTMEDVTDVIMTVSDALSMVITSLGMEKFGSAAKTFSESFGEATSAVTNFLKRVSNKLKMNALKDFAISVGILAGSLFLLSMIPTEKLLYAGIVLVGLAKALTYFFDFISSAKMNISETAGFLPLAAMILSLGAAMVAVAASLGILVGALALFPRVIKSYNNLGEEFRTGMDRVKEVLVEIFEYLDHAASSKYSFRSAAALLGLVVALGKIRKTIVKFANKKTGESMKEGLSRIKEVLTLLSDFLGTVALASLNFVNIGINFNTLGIAAVIWALGNMISKISGPIAKLSNLTPSHYKTAFSAIRTILVEFGIFLIAIGFMEDITENSLGEWLGMAATITLIASAIATVTNSLSVIAGLAERGKGLGTAILVLTGIFAGLGVLLFIIGKFDPKAATGTLFGLSLAIGLLTACVVALSPIAAKKPETLGAAVVALCALMTSLGIALYLAGEASYKTTAGDIAKLIIMTLAMVVLSTTLRRLARTGDPESLVTAGLAISAAVLSMAGAMKILSGIKMVSPSVLVGLGILAAAIWAVAFAIKWFKSSAGGMAESSNEVEQSVSDSEQHLEAYAGEVIPHLIDMIKQALGNLLPQVGDAIRNFDLGVYLREKFESLKADAKNWAQDFIDIGTNLMEGIATALSNSENIARIKECMVAVGKAILSAFKSFFGIASPSRVMAEQGGFILDGLVNGLMKFPGKIARWIAGIGKAIIEGIGSFFTGIIEKGASLIDGLIEGFQNGKELVEEKVAELGRAVLAALGSAGAWAEQAFQSVAAFASGIGSGIAAVVGAAARIATGIFSALGRIRGEMAKYAADAIRGFTAKLRAGIGAVKSAATSILTGAKSAFYGIYNSFATFGRNAAEGFRNGIMNMVSSIATAAANLVRRAKEAAKHEQHSDSPSKDFMEYGNWAAQGYALGLKNKRSSRMIEANARKMIDVAKNAMTSSKFGLSALAIDTNTATSSLAFAMSQISDTVGNEIDSNPRIRPVVDMNDVHRNASAISALFGSRRITAGVDIAGSIRSDFEQMRQNDELISTSLNKLTNKLGAMTETMNSRQMNNYIQIDGAEDPTAFADALTDRFKLKARAM